MVATLTDRSRVEPFGNKFTVSVKGPVDLRGTRGKRRSPPSREKGTERETPSGIALPKIIEVTQAEWHQHTPPFDQFTALRIRHAGTVGEKAEQEDVQTDVFDFYVNVDNIYFKNEVKFSGDDVELKKARFLNGLVLIGLAILHDDEQQKRMKNEEEGDSREEESESQDGNVEDRIERFTRALAPVLLPVIESLGTLDLENAAAGDASGEAV